MFFDIAAQQHFHFLTQRLLLNLLRHRSRVSDIRLSPSSQRSHEGTRRRAADPHPHPHPSSRLWRQRTDVQWAGLGISKFPLAAASHPPSSSVFPPSQITLRHYRLQKKRKIYKCAAWMLLKNSLWLAIVAWINQRAEFLIKEGRSSNISYQYFIKEPELRAHGPADAVCANAEAASIKPTPEQSVHILPRSLPAHTSFSHQSQCSNKLIFGYRARCKKIYEATRRFQQIGQMAEVKTQKYGKKSACFAVDWC